MLQAYNMGNIANIFNNYKWNIAFKNYESSYYTPVTYNIVYQLHFNS